MDCKTCIHSEAFCGVDSPCRGYTERESEEDNLVKGEGLALLRKEYNNIHKLIGQYFKIEGYKVRVVDTALPQIQCKCKRVLDITKEGFVLGMSQRVLFFYQAACEECKIAYVHKAVEVIKGGENE